MANDFKISLEACRVNARLSQKELAEMLGVATTTISNWESGKTEPVLSQLRRLSEITKIPMNYIYCPKHSN